MPDTRERSHRHQTPSSHATSTAARHPPIRRRRAAVPRHRLATAFEAFDDFPALTEARSRLLTLTDAAHPDKAEIVAVIESDVSLVIRVLRYANTVEGRVDTVVRAVEALSLGAIHEIAFATPTFDFFHRPLLWDPAPERARLHAVATQRAADRLARETGYKHRDRLMVTALLHDIGKLVLTHAYSTYPDEILGDAQTAEERVRRERRELIVDHALIGGALMRRWSFPDPIASAIERHHADEARGEAALVKLADMVAHYSQGDHIAQASMPRAAAAVGLDSRQLQAVLHDLPFPDSDGPRAIDPSPLSGREAEVLEHLADGKSYKDIADELELLTSTVRTHLASIYRKLAAVDRAQAVLIATKRGWL